MRSLSFFRRPAAHRRFIALCVFSVAGSYASAATAYDEAVSGDLSVDPANPTPITTSVGSNELRGSLNETGSKVPDYWKITIEPDQLLTQVVFKEFGPEPERSFFGVEFGDQITDVFTGAGLAGGDHIGAAPGKTPGSDVLDDLAAGPPISLIGTGFSTPLGHGTYSFWFQEGSAVSTTFDYVFDFRIVRVPDFNQDGLIDAADYTVWRDTLDQAGDLAADANGDQVVDSADYALWRDHYGLVFGDGMSTSVPEPSAWLCIGFGLACLAAASRHQ